MNPLLSDRLKNNVMFLITWCILYICIFFLKLYCMEDRRYQDTRAKSDWLVQETNFHCYYNWIYQYIIVRLGLTGFKKNVKATKSAFASTVQWRGLGLMYDNGCIAFLNTGTSYYKYGVCQSVVFWSAVPIHSCHLKNPLAHSNCLKEDKAEWRTPTDTRNTLKYILC